MAANLKEQITAQIAGMIYLSESEAPLQLLEWPEVKDVAGMEQQAAETAGQSMMKVKSVPADEFLSSIRSAADPADPGMTRYVHQYNDLFALLQQLRDLTVLRIGTGTIHLFMGGFTEDSCLVVYTTAVET